MRQTGRNLHRGVYGTGRVVQGVGWDRELRERGHVVVALGGCVKSWYWNVLV